MALVDDGAVAVAAVPGRDATFAGTAGHMAPSKTSPLVSGVPNVDSGGAVEPPYRRVIRRGPPPVAAAPATVAPPNAAAAAAAADRGARSVDGQGDEATPPRG